MESNRKVGHTVGVTQGQSHSDSAPYRTPLWPNPIVTPPFSLRGAVALPAASTTNLLSGHGRGCDIAVVRVTLHGEGVTQVGGQKTVEPFSLLAAATIAIEMVQASLPGAKVLLLLDGYAVTRRQSGPSDTLSLNTWRIYSGGQRWSMTPLEIEDRTYIGLFQNRTVRDAAPTWLWHYLAGRLLLQGAEVIEAPI